MINSLGQPDTLLLVGGSSDIAAATALTLARRRPLRVILAARPTARRDSVAAQLAACGADVQAVDIEATDVARAAKSIDMLFDGGDIDVAVVAHGLLPAQTDLEDDLVAAAAVCTVNYTSAVTVGLVLARRMSEQRHGVIVALSSVAAVRPRASTYLYGSTKAGLDAFFTGLRERLRHTGVRVLVVRPGFVRSRMTAGHDPAPFATTPQHVADTIAAALATGNRTVYAPTILGPAMAALRLLPGPVFRRLGH